MKLHEQFFHLADVSKEGPWYRPYRGETLDKLPDKGILAVLKRTSGTPLGFYRSASLSDLAAIFGLADLLKEMSFRHCQAISGYPKRTSSTPSSWPFLTAGTASWKSARIM